MIDHDLDRAIAAWSDLPVVERDIDGWRQLDQIDFVEEWTIQEDRLARLDQAAAAGAMTAAQRARYAELRELVDRHRPIVTRLRQ
jgi:hypothetical protein